MPEFFYSGINKKISYSDNGNVMLKRGQTHLGTAIYKHSNAFLFNLFMLFYRSCFATAHWEQVQIPQHAEAHIDFKWPNKSIHKGQDERNLMRGLSEYQAAPHTLESSRF